MFYCGKATQQISLEIMKCISVIVLLAIVWSTEKCTTAKPRNNSKTNLLERRKRQDIDLERWIWDSGDSIEKTDIEQTTESHILAKIKSNDEISDTDQTTEAQVSTAKPNDTVGVEASACGVPYLTKPDFSAPGRRISEIKCYEYIWDITARADREKKDRECKLLQKIPSIPYTIGGIAASYGQYPHMGALGWKASVGAWVFKCGCSLISDKFILTAAHCTSSTSTDTTIEDVVPKIVRLGEISIKHWFNKNSSINDVNITKIYVHPLYKAPKKYYDIALMELEKPVKFEFAKQPACIWRTFDTSTLGEKAVAGGWGIADLEKKIPSETLQVINIDIINSTLCDALLKPSCNRNWCGIEEHQICAGKLTGGVDTCQGDSGGPLQVKIGRNDSLNMHYLIGVTSFGFGCAIANKPGVYTRVSSFIDWIEDIVWR